MQPLSAALFREVRPDFFRVLSGPLARLYVDALDALEHEASQRQQGLDREEALALIEQTIESHHDLTPPEDEDFSRATTIRDKARAVLEVLRTTGWLQEEERTDWQRVVFFDPNGTLLLQAIRKIAFPEAAVFSDKIVNACVTLSHPDTLSDQAWAQIETCVSNVEGGLGELRAMQKSIERHTRQQLAASTLKENLSLLFDQFAERIGRACYAQLVHARLPSRLAEAQRAIEQLDSDAQRLAEMQTEVLRRDPMLSAESAMARVRLRLNELHERLLQVEPLAEAIDRRTAEFARRSQARFRYLQETTSENRARVQTFFETLVHQFRGRRIPELDDLGVEFPALLLHDVRLFGGLESLHTPRLRRAAGEIEPLEDTDPRHASRALLQLENNLRDSLTVGRANHFVQHLPGDPGTRWDSQELLRQFIRNDEDIANLIACLLHARSGDARFSLEVPRRESDADSGEFDSKLLYRIERFTLTKK
jgi:hypothetical protein